MTNSNNKPSTPTATVTTAHQSISLSATPASPATAAHQPITFNVRHVGSNVCHQFMAVEENKLPVATIQSAFGLQYVTLPNTDIIIPWDASGSSNVIPFKAGDTVEVGGPIKAEDVTRAIKSMLNDDSQALTRSSTISSHRGSANGRRLGQRLLQCCWRSW